MAEDSDIGEDTPSTIIIDKRGDVVLVIGSEQYTTVKLLVSSKVLSLASKVFDAMFAGGFAEGQNLSQASPREVPLPDDDPEHMTTICKLVHMQSSDVTDKLEIQKLIEFALLCDKYDCAVGVRSWIRLCMSWYGSDSSDSEQLLAIAYVLDLPQEFRDISKNLIHHRTDIIGTSFVVGEQERIPKQVLDILHGALLKNRLEATTAIISYDATNMLKHGEACPRASQTLWKYFQSLRDIGLLPIQMAPLVENLRQAELLQTKDMISSKQCSNYLYTDDEQCSDFQHIKKELLVKMQNIINAAQGLCLDCAKNSVRGEKRLRCRVAHEEHGLCWR